jgi:hypothetical protein
MNSKGLIVYWHAFLLCTQITAAQQYPLWFLYQGEIECPRCAVGYAEKTPLSDSIIAYLCNDAARNYATFKNLELKGEQAFLGTEAGKYRISASSIENIQQSDIDESKKTLRVQAKFLVNDCWIGLCCDSNATIAPEWQSSISVYGRPDPQWIDSIPKQSGFIYAVGFAPRYFHESSSWLEAERIARRKLALAATSNLQGVQEHSAQGKDFERSTTAITLRRIQLLERWVDMNNKLYYVLLRYERN